MCGIFGYVGSGNATKIVFEGLKSLEYRGYDSWGIVAAGSGGLALEKHVGKIGSSQLTLGSSKIALGHTRWATHGGVTDQNAHPHLDCTGNISVVHNGIIENYLELKNKLLDQGHKFVSETDTEIFTHLVEEAQKKLAFASAVKASFAQLKGFNTIVVISKNGDLVACKNGSPLVVGQGKGGELYISSDIPSLLACTDNIAVLKDGDIAIIKNGKLTSRHIFSQIKMDREIVELGEYPHYFIKEIHDQVEAIGRRISSDDREIIKARKLLTEAQVVYAIGCGTAYYSMLVASYLFARHSNIQIIPVSASEFNSFVHLVDKNSAVLLASQSGETIDTIQAMRDAKARGAKIIGLVNIPGSTLSREVDVWVSLLAGIEKAVVSSKAFTNMLVSAYLILGKRIDVSRAVNEVKEFFTPELELKLWALADKLAKHSDLYVIGRGQNYGVALEGALKMKEISYLHAEGFAGGELKHGVIALIDKGTPCLVIVDEGEERDNVLSGAMELKARGAWIIGIGPKKEEVFDDWIKVEDDEIISPILNVIPFQLLGYYLALAKNLDPDMPRNLAKSVTVK